MVQVSIPIVRRLSRRTHGAARSVDPLGVSLFRAPPIRPRAPSVHPTQTNPRTPCTNVPAWECGNYQQRVFSIPCPDCTYLARDWHINPQSSRVFLPSTSDSTSLTLILPSRDLCKHVFIFELPFISFASFVLFDLCYR